MHQLHPNHATKEFHHLSILNQSSLQSLRILNIDGLDVAVQTLGSTLLVVTLSRDADTESVLFFTELTVLIKYLNFSRMVELSFS